MGGDMRSTAKSSPSPMIGTGKRGSRKLFNMDPKQPTFHVIASISKGNNSWTETQSGEKKDAVRGGAIRDTPRPDADFFWDKRTPYDRSLYRHRGTTFRDSYVNDSKACNILKRDWRLRYCAGATAVYNEANPKNVTFPPVSFGVKPPHHTARHTAVGVLPKLNPVVANRQSTAPQGRY
eukprot:TRINITY_DN7729_c0_g2_i1.p2 TRINITY_DN7729_c0_g2~~TRINITY_DN7729_c0_g2_i1.p2  ORF type:complete len:179 (+),score=47.33 TRINITY_DN7729_c0_g2_i1:60-596(+)